MPARSARSTAASTTAITTVARTTRRRADTPTASASEDDGEHDRDGQAPVGDEAGRTVRDRRQPGRLAGRRGGEDVVQALRGPARALHRKAGQRGPQHEPHQPRPGRAQPAGGDERRPAPPLPAGGQSRTASTAYSKAAPGPPATGPAPPVSTPPSPSPSHHTASAQTIDAASAGLRVGRQAMPSPSRSWVRANAVFAPTECCAMRCATQVIGPATTAGLPAALDASIWRAKSLVNMYGWNCRMPSSNHSPARQSCRARRASRSAVERVARRRPQAPRDRRQRPGANGVAHR